MLISDDEVLIETEKVKNFLIQNKTPAILTTNRQELRIRCPYCGDSKDKSHAHLYVQMRPPFKFYCHKCNTAGVLNSKTMRDFQLYDTDISVSLNQLSQNLREKQGYGTVQLKKKTLNLEFRPEAAVNKVIYFNRRFNSSFTAEELVDKYRAVLDVELFVHNNNLPRITQYDVENAIGFVSFDQTYVIFRDITGYQLKRYFNYSLYPSELEAETSKVYSIKNKVDIMFPEVNLVLTEGIFDIIEVQNAFYPDTTNTIFAAACGKGYNAVISSYIHQGFLNLNISIYSDSDVDINFYRNLKESSYYLKRTPITIYYNILEKDYGIPKERIQLKKIII